MPMSKVLPNSPLPSPGISYTGRVPAAVIPPFVAMDMMREANRMTAEGRSIIHLETGQPASPPPRPVREAATRAIACERLGYTDALGLPGLRTRIARHYSDAYGVVVDPGRVAMTTGSSAGLAIALLALTGPGGRVGMARPSYPCYRNIALALGMTPVEIATAAEDGLQITAAALDRLDAPLDILLIASPANPTGYVMPLSQLAEIADWCRISGVRLVVDEVYHGITYDAPAATILEIADDAIVLNGFSKYYSMTGWRLGWMIAPMSDIRGIECLAQNLYIAPPSISQYAASAAFDATDELQGNIVRYAANRGLLLGSLPHLGLTLGARPDGAFYLYMRMPDDWPDSPVLAQRWLAEIGVSVTPGIDFDPVDGHRFIRFAYAGATDEIVEAIERLNRWRN